MNLPILYAGNRRVFDGIFISLLSVIRNRRDAVDVYLLTMDLREKDETFLPVSEEQRAYLEAICREVNPESRVRLIDVKEYYAQTLLDAPNQDNQYTPYSFLRLYADRIPELPRKIIYLDTDTVLRGDIEELYREDLDGAEFGAVRDRYGCHFFGINYLNSGVLLMDLDRIRETGVFRRALDACAKKKIFLPDQTTINRLAKKKKILPRRYNEQKSVRGDTLIRHFSMTIKWFPKFRTQNIKPWNVQGVHEILHEHTFDPLLGEYLTRLETFPQ